MKLLFLECLWKTKKQWKILSHPEKPINSPFRSLSTGSKKKDNKLLGLFMILLLLQNDDKEWENRGNNFHKTQQCEKEKIIKGRKKGLEGKRKNDPKKRRKNILFNSISKFYLPFVISLFSFSASSFVAVSWTILSFYVWKLELSVVNFIKEL